MMYALTGSFWADTNVSYSFMPDGTVMDGGYSSELYRELSSTGPLEVWQREVARALQTWANYSPLNFRLVADDGSPTTTIGFVQGDSRVGDIRFGARPLTVALAGTRTFGSSAGNDHSDIVLNSSHNYGIGSDYDLYSVLVHEIGHSLGLGHGGGGTVMYDTYSGVLGGLSSDDIAGVRAIYGARVPDMYDAAASNNSVASATALPLSSNAVSIRADLMNLADVDCFRFVAPASFDGTLSASVDARGVSLLAPKVLVYDGSGALIASASGQYGGLASVSIGGLVPGQTYVVVADGASGDVFGMGTYQLGVHFGGVTPTLPPIPDPIPDPTPDPVVLAPAAPTNLQLSWMSKGKVRLNWTDNADNESGYLIQRSTDGQNWSTVATLGPDSTSYVDAVRRKRGATIYYRVIAYNDVGQSDPSNAVRV